MIYVIVIDALYRGETEALAENISLDNYLCNCNCKPDNKNILQNVFMYVMFLWMTVPLRRGRVPNCTRTWKELK